MGQVIKIVVLGKYHGHSIKPSGSVDLQFKIGYDELENYYMKLPLLRSENTTIIVEIDGNKLKLGTFMFHNFSMDRDGEAVVKFNSLFDNIEADNVNMMVPHKDKLLKMLFKAEIEVDEDDE